MLFNIAQKSPTVLWQARKVISIIHQSGLLQTLEVGENLITASHALLPGWTIPHWQVPDEVKLPKTLTLVYHLPIELHTMAERLQATLAAEGCELTIIFHNAKNWDDTTLLAHADLMMGDRLIGEAPEYTLGNGCVAIHCGHMFSTLQHMHICNRHWTQCK